MPTVALLFSTTNSPFSWLIRLLTWSRWSHVSIIDGDEIIQAHALQGVVAASYQEAIEAASACEMVRIPCPDPGRVIAAARSQIGKGYDWAALFGFLFRRDWQDDAKWFCSELVAWSFQQAGCLLFRPDRIRRVTPEHIFMLPPAAEEVQP